MDTYSLLPENEYTEVENRRYLVPTLGVTQTNDFIDNLRANQRTQNAQINQQTQNLGTKIPSVMGGLTGGTGYWTSRYQTPQTNMAAASLRAASQADALKTALANEKSYWQKKYQDAYRAYQKSAYDKSQAAAAAQQTKGGVSYEDNSNPVSISFGITAKPGQTVAAEPDGIGGTTGRVFVADANGNGQWIDQNIKYSHDVGRAAGAEQLSDIVTGMYNYTLPNGTEVELGGWDENLMKGTDGNYYIWNNVNNTYTPITGVSGRTSGGGRWWTN